MPADHLVGCGGLPPGPPPADFDRAREHALNNGGDRPNVRLRIEDVHHLLKEALPDALLDLLDVAAYVYAADQCAPRSTSAHNLGDRWHRRFRFRVPVRVPDLWTSPAVARALPDALAFLTDDEYRFEFEPWAGARPGQQQYFAFGGTPFAAEVDEVALYSGGLDSLAGAVDAAVNRKVRAVAVNHRSHEKWTRRLNDLRAALAARVGPLAPVHVPVHANRHESLGRENTQRSRMFLYASLGFVVARMLGKSELRVYENGVVGLNLPILGQLVGARASRTTHPRALDLLARLFSALTGAPFGIANPFLWHTKADVVRVLADAGCADLIGLSLSCGHTISRTNAHPHCGVCSQCIDRRFGVLAAGQAAHDPAGQYQVDLVTGDRAEPEDRAMLVGYVDRALGVRDMTAANFSQRYGGELARVYRRVPGLTAAEVAEQAFDLHKRHADDVNCVLSRAVRDHADALVARSLPAHSLVPMTVARAAPALTDAAPDYVFRLKGDFWEVRYAGRETKYVKASSGMGMIRTLVSRPRERITSFELTEGRPPDARQAAAANGVPAADTETLRRIRARLAEITEELEEANGSGDVAAAEALTTERERLLAQVRAATTHTGRIRTVGGNSERARSSATVAINRALKAVHVHDEQCAAHLREHIRRGTMCCYDPPDPANWHVDPAAGRG